MSLKLFREENTSGRLMLAQIDEKTRFKYTIWFDYTQKLMNEIRDGDIVGIPNFSLNTDGQRWSILEITNVLPLHYALGKDLSDLKGYPGFVMEAAKNASTDWTTQESESHEDTTKIICEAIPINLEFVDKTGIKNINEVPLEQESAMPMVGKEVKLLSSELTKKIVNMSIHETENTFSVGTLLRDDKIDILIRVEDLIKKHFGIFGFTGVGKSNLVSTLVSEILTNSKETIKIVLFDLMDEYTGILIDQILNPEINVNIICLGQQTLSDPVFNYINNPSKLTLDSSVSVFIRNLLLPKKLRSEKDKYNKPIRKLLESNKIKILDIFQDMTVGEFFNDRKDKLSTKTDGAETIKLMDDVYNIFRDQRDTTLTKQVASELCQKLEQFKNNINHPTVIKRIEYLMSELEKIAKAPESAINDNIKISIQEIIKDLNDKNKSSLFLIISHDPDKIRSFAKKLGGKIYESRRISGDITPLVSFIFDEADEFIPGEPPAHAESYKDSKEIIEKLARRGRKFGLGISIATQRITYLDTNIMAQPHTYFISKLPRKSDRERVGEAFAISEDMFTQTLKFQQGNWLLVSHDATGLDAVPIPIKTPNAEERIEKFINKS